MTPAQKDMAELGLDEQALAERQEHISQLLNGSVHEQLKASVALVDNISTDGTITYVKPRKRRSDAGKPKPKRPAIAQQPGFLSAEQASRLNDLIQTQESRRIELESAEAHKALCLGQLDAARQELYDYLLELQGKKTG